MPRSTSKVFVTFDNYSDKYKKHFEEEKRKKLWWQGLVSRLESYQLTDEEKLEIKKELTSHDLKMNRKM